MYEWIMHKEGYPQTIRQSGNEFDGINQKGNHTNYKYNTKASNSVYMQYSFMQGKETYQGTGNM